MAIEILEAEGVIHEARHDLESFYWLLVWLVLRHTNYHYTRGPSPLENIFGGHRDDCLMKKHFILTYKKECLFVKGNGPLTDLLKEFRQLCSQSFQGRKEGSNKLTHADVLRIFKAALNRDDWPSNDRALPYRPASAPKPLHPARSEASIESGRVESLESLECAHRGKGGSAADLSALLPAYKPVAPLSRQQGIVSESVLTALQSQLPDTYAGTITNALSTSFGHTTTNAPVPLPVVGDVQVARPMLSYSRGISDSAALRLKPSFFPGDPTSPSPLPRESAMNSIRHAFRYSQAREQSPSPDDVESESDVLKRLTHARPPSSRAGSPQSNLSAHAGEEDSSDVGSQLTGQRKRSRSPEELEESEVEAGPSKRSRTRSRQSFRASAAQRAPEASEGRAVRDERSGEGHANPAERDRSERRRRR